MRDDALRVVVVVEAALLAWLGWLLLVDAPTSASPPRVDRPSETSMRDAAEVPRSTSVGFPTSPEAMSSNVAGVAQRHVALLDHVLLFGRVTISDGSPLAYGFIQLKLEAPPSAARAYACQLDPNQNRYAFPLSTAGTYEVTVGAGGCRTVTRSITIVPGVMRHRYDIVLTKSWLLRVVCVTRDGTPLSEALAQLQSSSPGLARAELTALATIAAPVSPLRSGTTSSATAGLGIWRGNSERLLDAQNPASLRQLGLLELAVDVPLFVSVVLRSAVLATQRVEPGQEEVRIVVPVESVVQNLATVRLRLVDAVSGAPITNASVVLSESGGGGNTESVDEEGRVTLTVPPGLLELRVKSDRLTMPPWSVDVPPGAQLDLGTLRMTAPMECALRIEGAPPGRPIRCWVESLEAVPHPALRAREDVRVTEDGTISLRLAPGRHTLRVTAGEMLRELELDTRTLGAAPIVVSLQAGAALRVIPPPLERLAVLAITDVRGKTRFDQPLNWTSSFELTLVPGSYVAEITRPDGNVERRTLELTKAGLELDLR